MSILSTIQQGIVNRDYYLSSHAEGEIMDDGFERADVENAIPKGLLEKKMTHDTRGTRYCIEGSSLFGRSMYVVCRFREEASLIIITVYAI